MAGQPEAWQRWKLPWQHGFVVLFLGLVLATALPGSHAPAGTLALRAGLVAGLGAWYGYWFGLRPARSQAPAHLPYLAGAAVLWTVAVTADRALLPAGAVVLIPYCMRSLGWLAAVCLAWNGVLSGQRLIASGGALGWPAVTDLLGSLATVAALGFVATLDRQGRARQRLLDELAAAQAGRAAAERAAGALAERQRLARDIHDTLTQGFASVAMLLDAAQAALDPGHQAAGPVSQALQAARENLAESRRVVWALRPAPLDRARLPGAVAEMTDRLAEQTGIRAGTVVTGQPAPLPAPAEASLLRVVQEALANVRKHAGAAEVTVTLSYMDGTLAVDVHDDGAGFPADGERPTGVGLAAMAERVAELGGWLTVESAPGDGTTIAAQIPAIALNPGTPDTPELAAAR